MFRGEARCSSLTVLENLEMGAGTETGAGNWARTLDRSTLFPCGGARSAQAGLCPATAQMLAIARGWRRRPAVMLDEPSLGLAPAVRR